MNTAEWLAGPQPGTLVIYALSDPRTYQVRYVGQTNNYQRRMSGYFTRRRFHSALLMRWFQELQQFNLQPHPSIVEECDTYDDLDARERFWVERLRERDHPLVNIADGGGGAGGATKTRRLTLEDWEELACRARWLEREVQEFSADLRQALGRATAQHADEAYQSLCGLKPEIESAARKVSRPIAKAVGGFLYGSGRKPSPVRLTEDQWRRLLWAARLSEIEADVFLRRMVAAETSEEVARALGSSAGSVRAASANAWEKLKRHHCTDEEREALRALLGEGQ